jgi:hypothetical protein
VVQLIFIVCGTVMAEGSAVSPFDPAPGVFNLQEVGIPAGPPPEQQSFSGIGNRRKK